MSIAMRCLGARPMVIGHEVNTCVHRASPGSLINRYRTLSSSFV